MTITNLAKWFATMEELLRPLQPLADGFDSLEKTVADQGQQQAALILVLTRLERLVCQGQVPHSCS